MEVKTKIKRIGKKIATDATVVLPDKCAKYFDNYTFDMHECGVYNCMCIYFQDKTNPDVDVVSYTVYNYKCSSNVSNGFKRIFQILDEIEKKKKKKTK